MKLKLPDAIHLTSAVQSDCKFVVTGDTDFKRLRAGVRHIRPDEKGVESLLRELV
jgi:predicted nucleic acid-binding protein